MRRSFSLFTPLLGLAALCFVAADLPARLLTGKVVQVVDGDTLEVLDSQDVRHRIRILGIDAPEGGKIPEHGQPYGSQARDALKELVGAQPVRVVWRKQDSPYKGHEGRILGDVYVDNAAGKSVWVNRAMIDAGLAWHFRHYDQRKELEDAERTARNEKRGLWRDAKPMPPWDFRERHRERYGEN